jgi:hypothetical protein
VDYTAITRAAFLDELTKIAVSRDRLNVVAQSRTGVRPISVDKLLEKDKAGTLFKKEAEDWASPPVDVGVGVADPASARRPRRKGDVPTQDDTNKIDRSDGRENAVTTTGLGSTFNNISACGNSAAGT